MCVFCVNLDHVHIWHYLQFKDFTCPVWHFCIFANVQTMQFPSTFSVLSDIPSGCFLRNSWLTKYFPAFSRRSRRPQRTRSMALFPNASSLISMSTLNHRTSECNVHAITQGQSDLNSHDKVFVLLHSVKKVNKCHLPPKWCEWFAFMSWACVCARKCVCVCLWVYILSCVTMLDMLWMSPSVIPHQSSVFL